jgi:hypothetical protein
MTTTALKQEVTERLDSLPPEDQRRVLELARSLTERRPAGVAGRDLLRFMGTIEKTDLDVMRRAIEEDCERIDDSEW